MTLAASSTLDRASAQVYQRAPHADGQQSVRHLSVGRLVSRTGRGSRELTVLLDVERSLVPQGIPRRDLHAQAA